MIFDFDYTLADATEAIIECFNYGFEMVGLQSCEVSDIKNTIGMRLPDAFIKLTEIDEKSIIEEFRKHFKIKADKLMTAKTTLFDDTVPILKYLKENDIKTGIVTNKFRYRIEETLAVNNISDLIDIIIGYEDVTNHKPDPTALIAAVDKFMLPKETVLYIGDSVIDAEASQHAGIDFVAVTTGTTTKDEFNAFNYKDIINNLSELKCIMSPQNVFNDDTFFEGYLELRQNPYCANIVEEKPAIFSLLPDLNGLDVLDLGCGYGENCYEFYKIGARNIIGIDIADKMLDIARSEHIAENITYINMSMEDIKSLNKKFDLIISSLAIHYVKDFNKLVRDVCSLLNNGGVFIFSQEHPFNTAPKTFLGWGRDDNNIPLFYKLTDYNVSGERKTTWIIDNIVKYHRKFADIVNGLVMNGFDIAEIIEPLVSDEIITAKPSYIKNIHKPNFLVIKAVKNNEY